MLPFIMAGSFALLALAPTAAHQLPTGATERPGASVEAVTHAERRDSAGVLVGEWVGGIEQSGMVVLRLRVEFARATSGEIAGTMDSPDQGARGIPIDGVRILRDSVWFAVPSLGANFRGTIGADGMLLSGIWTQGPTSVGMSLRRGSGATSFARPQEPAPPYPYREMEVAYTNAADGTRLSGTLALPDGSGPFPAALLLSGSGAQDRNGSLMGHRPFRVIADHLARHGVAVLRVDDRGVGGSSGDVMAATLHDNAEDAAAGLRLLRSHSPVDARSVGLIGHSEGGWLAPLIASRDDGIAFVVMLAGPAVTAEELLLAQTRAMLVASGDSAVDAQVELTRRTLRVLRAEPDDGRAAAAIRTARREWLAGLPPDAATRMRRRTESEQYQAEMQRSLLIQTSRWFRTLLAHDPAPPLAALRVPVLALYAERDLQVPPAQSVPVLEQALARHPDATIRVLPGLNHLFQHARTGLPDEYAQIEETFAPAALDSMTEWIVRRFAR